MRIIIIRHGDPDYSIDSLTETGWKEARLLAERLAKTDMTEIYVSPLGRAQDTLKPTLEKTGRTATTLEWLREFNPRINRPDVVGVRKLSWDWLPQDWTKDANFFDRNLWHTNPVFVEADVKKEYDWVIQNFDALLAEHGYVRDGDNYRVERPNRDTLVFVCHFGLECVLLSRLMNASPMVLWQGMCAAPSSFTSIYTEERREGIASFRMSCFGDTSHLYAAGEEPSFAARFCETYDCAEERHD
ncbi:MAG: histidine phosphatase family protein [Roseburia sp.]|nr:histidine phosphatase family protein [Roseburia sp.]